MIDVHHHFVPDRYRAALERSGHGRPDGMPAIPAWSEALALEFLDEAGIELAFLSISSPGVFLDGEDAPVLARLANETSAGLAAAHPGRFGGFASLPLPDVDRSLAELAYALDELGLDGVALLTHYGDAYLGDHAFDPVFDELNRRKATVFIHPTSPVCCDVVALGYPRPMLEFLFDTTRTVTNLIYSGTFDRCPAISWIVPHAGAALPLLGARLEFVRAVAPERDHARAPVDDYLRRLYYDLAGPRTDDALAALLGIADPSHLLYGSDWPFTPTAGVARGRAALGATNVLTAAQLEAVFGGNAAAFLSRAARR